MNNEVKLKEYKATELAIRIENALGKGKENAITMPQLLLKLSMSDTNNNRRKIRKSMESMRLNRLNKTIILSANDGYWCENSYEECADWLNFMMSYLKDISHMVKIVGQNVEEKYHKAFQIPMWLE
jgi:tRNA U54 and U55 pseudouridine synthase Pus10